MQSPPHTLLLQYFPHTLTSCESIDKRCCPRFSDIAWGEGVDNSLSLCDFTITDTDRPFATLGMSTYSLLTPPPATRLLARGGRGMVPMELVDVLGLKISGDEDE